MYSIYSDVHVVYSIYRKYTAYFISHKCDILLLYILFQYVKATTPPQVVTHSYVDFGKRYYYRVFTGYDKGRRPMFFGRPALHV